MSSSRQEPDWPPWVQEWILPYVGDEALWPVAVALVGHIVMVQVPLLLAVWRTAHPAALAPLFVLVVISFAIVRFERTHAHRFGRVTWAVLLDWTAAVGMAALCEKTGIL